jgi:hypothetical protein
LVEISLLSKQNKKLRHLFEERKSQSSGHETPDDIFYDPSRLLKDCGLKGVLDGEPFKYIMTAGSVWEFYLLRFAKNVGLRQYNKLIKPISWSEEPVADCSRRKLGNPYDTWHDNYPEINNRYLREATESFANKLVSRKCPIRQKGSDDFIKKRKNAAKYFFKYLIGRKITQTLFDELRECEDFKDSLILLIKSEDPHDKLFLTSGLMTCLYGGRNADWINANLARTVATALKNKCYRNSTPIIRNVCNILDSQKNKKYFKPPFKDIYDVRVGGRERVNINFRIQTWLKLLEDTLRDTK